MGLRKHGLSFTNLVCVISSILISIAAPTHQYCYNNGFFTANSSYAENLNRILSSLAADASSNGGFYKATVGQDPDQVYALALCRGDSTPEVCASCVNATIQEIMKECPNQKEALYWESDNPSCLVRYANHFFFGKLDSNPTIVMYNEQNITMNWAQFDQTWKSLMPSIVNKASQGSSRLKFATEKANLTYVETIYALMQCTPDLLQEDCNYCLADSVHFFHSRHPQSMGGQVRRANCIFEWELFPFYIDTPPPSPYSPTAPPDHKGGIPLGIFIPALTVIVALVLIAFICFLLKKNAKATIKKQERAKDNDDEIMIVDSLQFDFSTIKDATNNFSIDCKLGQGGFGAVYKGRLPDGQDIAVKRLSGHSGQGDLEFKNEVLILAMLQHRNLVRLLGFCLEGIERLLIYEFLPNSSLDKFIFDPIKRLSLYWEKRYKIIGGIARGILYLHEDSRLRIIHRDLKVSNILLDENMTPKISDFGVARLFEMNQTQADTNRVVGTFGYMAPEYIRRGNFSVKSDVFSFGVLVLEIISGQKCSHFPNEEETEGLLSYVWRNWKEGTALNVIDPTMMVGSSDEMLRCMHIGLLCVQENEVSRPTMASVVLMLSGCSVLLPEPSEPAFLMHTNMEQNNLEVNISYLSKCNSVQYTVNEASITELHPR